MQVLRRILLTCVASASCSAEAQLIEPHSAADRALVESVKTKLSSCFTSMGVSPSIPLASALPPPSEWMASVLMRASGAHVNDGYAYQLMLSGRDNVAYVVQMGGFADPEKVYGPVSFSKTCH